MQTKIQTQENKMIEEKVDKIMENITEDENLIIIRDALSYYFQKRKEILK